MAALALLCVAIGLAAPVVVAALPPVGRSRHRAPAAAVQPQLAGRAAPLGAAVAVFAAAIAIERGDLVVARAQARSARHRYAPVWGCGYFFPTARMQYTASSLVQPLMTQFRLFVRNREALAPPQGYFPRSRSYASDSGDPLLRLLFVPTFRWFDRIAAGSNVIQHGHIHVYVLYVAATLVALLVWASL